MAIDKTMTMALSIKSSGFLHVKLQFNIKQYIHQYIHTLSQSIGVISIIFVLLGKCADKKRNEFLQQRRIYS